MSSGGESMKNSELVFGLVAPIGTDATKVAEHLVSQLVEFGYTSTVVRLSDFIEPMSRMLGLTCELRDSPEHDRIFTRIKAANAARQAFNKVSEPQYQNAMLALAAVEKIASARKSHAPSDALLNGAHIL